VHQESSAKKNRLKHQGGNAEIIDCYAVAVATSGGLPLNHRADLGPVGAPVKAALDAVSTLIEDTFRKKKNVSREASVTLKPSRFEIMQGVDH
jgi:hypothetical protein